MVNDTTTLNGALSELGETMADNLQSMGVIDADATDGLTTLANKILDIEPSISGLDLDTSLVLHSSDDTCLIGQSIMFWAELKADYDDETATDVDLSGVLTGATVEFKNGNTVLGTAVTDSDGIAYYTHTFATAGVYDISASFNGTENFDDCVSNSISVSVTYRLVITADKPILSYNDHEYATISATLSDGAGGVSGETLSYEILDKEDNVLDSGSDVTDALGEISFTYQSAGVGDVQVIVYYGMFLQETYAIEDCFDADALTSNNNKFSLTGGTANISYSNTGLSFVGSSSANALYMYTGTLPNNYIAEFDVVSFTLGAWDNSGEILTSHIGISETKQSNVVKTRFMTFTDNYSSYTGYNDLTRVTPPYHLKVVVENGTATFYVDDVQIHQRTTGNTDLGFKSMTNRGVTVKNMKIKAL